MKAHHKIAIRYAVSSVSLLALGLYADFSMARDIGQVALGLTNQADGVSRAIGSVAYAGGMGMGALAAFKLKAHRDNPQQTPLSTPITLLGVAALLLFLPSTIETGADTVWGVGAGQSQGSTGQSMQIR